MSIKKPLTSIAPPVPELPVTDVERAQQHYRDALGFEIAWPHPDKEIGAVSRGDVAIFLRKRTPPFEPAIHWVFALDVDATYDELRALGATIVERIENKPWGLWQFAVDDLYGNRFYFHHDLPRPHNTAMEPPSGATVCAHSAVTAHCQTIRRLAKPIGKSA